MRNIISLAILISLSCSSFAAGLIGETESLQLADGLYVRKMYSMALKEYDKFIESFPSSSSLDAAWFRKGECYRSLGDKSAAEKAFGKVFKNYPESRFRLRAGFKRADVFMDAGMYQPAVELFTSVLEEKPDADIASGCLYQRGRGLEELGRTEDARKSYETLLSSYSDSTFMPYACVRLGHLYTPVPGGTDTGGVEKATGYYSRAYDLALEAGSTNLAVEALFQQAQILFFAESYSQSSKLYGRLIELYPGYDRTKEAALQGAWAAYNSDLYDEALTRAELAIKAGVADASLAEWLYLKANCERQLLKNSESIKTYELLLNIKTESAFIAPARYEMALTAYRSGNQKLAIKTAESIKDGGDLKEDIFWLLAEASSAIGNDDKAIQYYRLLLTEFPASTMASDAAYRIAHALQKKEMYVESSRFYRRAADKAVAPELSASALFASACCLSRAGKYEDTLRDLSVLLKLHPESALREETLYQKAINEVRLKRNKEAQLTLSLLMKEFPESQFMADAHYWTGVLLFDEKRYSDAALSFKAAQNQKPRADLKAQISLYYGLSLKKLDKNGEALAVFESLLNKDNTEQLGVELLQWIAEAQFSASNYEASVKASLLISSSSKEPSVQQMGHTLAGRAYLSSGNTNSAEKAFASALALDVDSAFAAESALKLGNISLDKNNYKAASELYREAGVMASGDESISVRARSYLGIAKVLAAEKKYDDAGRYFMSVAILFDDDELVPYSLNEAVRVFNLAGKPEEAAAAEADLKSRYPDK